MQVAAVDAAGELHGAADVLGEDAGRQAVGRVVGQADRLVDRIGTRHGHGRPEQLVATDLHPRVDVGHERRLVDRAPPPAAGHQSGAAGHGFLDPGRHAFGVGLADHGAHLRFGVELVAGREGLDPRLEQIDQIVVDPAQRDHALRRDAHLPGVGIAGGHGGGGHFFQIGVVHHDDRAVGAQFHRDAA